MQDENWREKLSKYVAMRSHITWESWTKRASRKIQEYEIIKKLRKKIRKKPG